MPQPLLTEAGLVMEVMEEVMVVDGRTVAAGTHLIFVAFICKQNSESEFFLRNFRPEKNSFTKVCLFFFFPENHRGPQKTKKATANPKFLAVGKSPP